VHYVEAVLYSGINPNSMPKMVLLNLSFTIGPRLRRKPMCVPVTSLSPVKSNLKDLLSNVSGFSQAHLLFDQLYAGYDT
jgi:hypothetical protein